MYVADAITNYLYKNKKKRRDLEKKTDEFKLALNNFININNIDARIYSYSSMLRIVFSKKNIINRTQRDFFEKNNKKIIDKFAQHLWKKGINFPKNGIIFFSLANTNKDISYIKKTIEDGLKLLSK